MAYPSTTLHRVETVTRGTRLDGGELGTELYPHPARRELLLDLDMTRRSLFQSHGKTPSLMQSRRRLLTCCACGRTPESVTTTSLFASKW